MLFRSLWTNTAELAPTSTDLSLTEAKFRSFAELPVNEVRVVVRELSPMMSTTDRAIVVPLMTPGTSLRALVTTPLTDLGGSLAGGRAGVATSLPRDTWRSLLQSPGLQCNCGLQGFNISAAFGVNFRLGIIGNQENDCQSPDSYLGVGGPIAAGNTANGTWACGGDYSGDRNTRLFAFVYVR